MDKPMRALPLLMISASLAGCGRSDSGTAITLNAADGTTIASADGDSGAVKLALPGLEGKVTLPKLHVTADDFDLNGVHLYPGSTIRALNVDAAQGGAPGGVRVTFTSPATPLTVRNWLSERLTKAGFTVAPTGDGLVGETNEHKLFALSLTPAAGGKASNGTIALGD
jgi:hypothetical protein